MLACALLLPASWHAAEPSIEPGPASDRELATRLVRYVTMATTKPRPGNKEAARGLPHRTLGNLRLPPTHQPVIHGALEAARRSDNAKLDTDDEAIRCASLLPRSSLAPQLPALCTTVAVCQQGWGALSGCNAAGVAHVLAQDSAEARGILAPLDQRPRLHLASSQVQTRQASKRADGTSSTG